jgi:hypothetical protein
MTSRVPRRELLAYLIGAGVAGTILVGPYVLRIIAGELFVPGRVLPMVPIVTLPLVWGVWNVTWARRQPASAIGLWGAALGLILACVINGALAVRGMWFRHALAIVPFLPLVYWLLWGYVVGPLNEALGVEGSGLPARSTRRETPRRAG